MEHFELIRQLAGQWNAFSVFLQKYGMYLTAAALVFALLNCFLGYRLRKLWIVLVSFLAGSAVGLAVCIHMRLSLRWSLLAALAAGIFCALLGYLLYRAGLFILCWGVTVFLLLQLLHPASTAALAACLIAGAAAGGFALARERVTVSLVTAIGGGCWFCFSSAVSRRTGQPSPHHSADSDSGLSGHSGSAEAMEEQRLLGAGRSESAAGKSGAGQAPQVPEEAETERKKGETKKTAPEKT